MLREIDDQARMLIVRGLPYRGEFDRDWLRLTPAQREAIDVYINARLDQIRDHPDAQWGSITNTSLEGARSSPVTGKRGDWTGTAYEPLFDLCGQSEEAAGMFLGNVWKRVIIERPEWWVGIRADPTFPARGITLLGKSYFLDATQVA